MSSRPKNRQRLLAAATLASSLLLALVLSEGLMRALGYSRWTYNGFDVHEPTMHEPDAELGWRNRPGSYVVPRYLPSGQDIHVTIEEPGRRRTRPSPAPSPDGALILVGDSYAVGWAISDEETFAWKLQEKFPAIDVLNYGTAGYGTYQSLLMLERVLPTVTRPRLVLYDFLEGHELRNAVPDSWLEDLARLSQRGHVRVPRATLGENGELVRHAPEGYVELPFRERSVFMNVLGRAFMHLRTQGRLSTKRAVTERILLEMDRAAQKSGTELLVVFLGASPEGRRHYQDFLASHRVAYLDCIRNLTDDLLVQGEGHPNGKANSLWAGCIAAGVAPRLGYEAPSSSQIGDETTLGNGRRRRGANRRRADMRGGAGTARRPHRWNRGSPSQ